MSLVFEALRNSESDLPGRPSPVGTVLAHERNRRSRWILPLLAFSAGGLAVGLYLNTEQDTAAPELTHQTDAAPRVEPTVTLAKPQGQTSQTVPVSTKPVPMVTPEPAAQPILAAAEPVSVKTPVAVKPAPVIQQAPTTTRPVIVAKPASTVPPVAETKAVQAVTKPTPAAQPILVAERPVTVTKPVHVVAKPAPVIEAPPPVVNPAHVLARFNAAMARGDMNSAQTILGQARTSLGTSHLLILRMEGYYCMRSGCMDEARQAYEAVLVRLPKDRDAGYNLAVMDWQNGRHEQARQRVRTLLAYHPNDRALRALQQATEDGQ